MTRSLIAAAAALTLALTPAAGTAQHHKNVVLHVDPRWEECAFRLDAGLSRDAWRQFTREAALVAYLRPLADARPMGAGNFEVSVLQWETRIDDTNAAWNDTFVHPDSTHWLVDGPGLRFPGLMVRRGMARHVDAGLYFAKNPQSNYGFYGGQLQYSTAADSGASWAAAARLSAVSLFGPDDLEYGVVGADLLASRTWAARRWASISPYAGVSTYLARAREKSDVVDLATEYGTGARATVGAVARLSVLTLGMEYSAAKVSSRSLKVGIAF